MRIYHSSVVQIILIKTNILQTFLFVMMPLHDLEPITVLQRSSPEV